MLINNLSILVFKRRVMLNGEKIFHRNQARFSLKHVPTIKCKFLTYPHFIILPIFLLRGPKKNIIINITINKLTVDGCSLNVDLLVLCFFEGCSYCIGGCKIFVLLYRNNLYLYCPPILKFDNFKK